MRFLRPKIRRLIEARIHGEATAGQIAQLEEYLERHPELAAFVKKLEDPGNKLGVKPATAVPHDIAEGVMNRIAGLKSSPSSTKNTVHTPPLLWLSNFPMSYAAVLIIGLLIGSAATWLLNSNSGTASHQSISGSIGAVASEGFSYRHEYTTIKLVPYTIGDLSYLNFFVDSEKEIGIEVQFNPSDYLPLRSEYLETEGDRKVDLSSGQVRFMAGGRTNFQLIMEKQTENASQLDITAYLNQTMLFTKQLNDR